jgi:DNA-binding response OmpR family regulator
MWKSCSKNLKPKSHKACILVYLYFEYYFDTTFMNPGILIIEDEEHVRETIALLLQNADYRVKTLSGGEGLYEAIESFQPDVILLDIILKNEDGRTICKGLKSNPETSAIPVVILSAVPEIYNTISEVGANDVISKPFNERTLLSRIQRQLSNSASANLC